MDAKSSEHHYNGKNETEHRCLIQCHTVTRYFLMLAWHIHSILPLNKSIFINHMSIKVSMTSHLANITKVPCH